MHAQVGLSVASNASIQRNFKNTQHYWSFGQNVIVNWHFSAQGGAYVSVAYYSNGRFKNTLTANAKSPLTLPQQLIVTDRSKIRLEQISIGWRQYFVGNFDSQKWNLYGTAGFGLVFGEVTNLFSAHVDSSLYAASVREGVGHFKRLSLDLGLGAETPIGTGIYLYGEAKVWIPTTDYPSKYLFENTNAPFAGMINGGLRVVF